MAISSTYPECDTLARAMMQELLRASDLSPDELDRLETRADVEYSVHKMGLELMLSWRLRPEWWWEPASPWRQVQCFIDEAQGDARAIKSEFERLVKNTDLRAELHHLKLARHFPTTLEKVAIERRVDTMTNIVTVTFKNGYHCSCPEDEVDSRDFLAKCQMIYDL